MMRKLFILFAVVILSSFTSISSTLSDKESQMMLFMAAHSYRHTQQIEEVKADSNYPRN